MIQRKTYIIKLTTVEPFRIGGKEDPLSEADNPVAVVGGRVCIPGPSLKGAYRAELERWLNDQFFDKQKGHWTDKSLRPCIPTTKPSDDEQELISRGHFRNNSCKYGQKRSTTICPVCYLLGAQGLVGFVNAPFLFSDVKYESLYSARLERTTRTVSKGTNRPYQLIPPETTFTGEIEILLEDDLLGWELGKPRPLKENPDADAWLTQDTDWDQTRVLQELIIDRLEHIDRLGGYRSKGFGKVSIHLSEKSS